LPNMSSFPPTSLPSSLTQTLSPSMPTKQKIAPTVSPTGEVISLGLSLLTSC
jgi:hypothetical protein